MLVIMAGLPGTGKTTLCHALAALSRSAVLNKDVIRDAIFGAAHTDYSGEQDDLCGEMMLAAAGYLLKRDKSLTVYLDGRTYSRRYQLQAATMEAVRGGVPWRILHCVCPDEEARRRLESTTEHVARNRNYELYRQIKAQFEPIAIEHLILDTSLSLSACVHKAAAYCGTEFVNRGEHGEIQS